VLKFRSPLDRLGVWLTDAGTHAMLSGVRTEDGPTRWLFTRDRASFTPLPYVFGDGGFLFIPSKAKSALSLCN